MAPVTFHGGPLHGQTVDADLAVEPGTYRLDGLSALWSAPATPVDASDVVHVRPEVPVVELELRPKRRQVTRR